MSLVTQLGLSVMTPIFLCIFAGNYIDSRFGTKTMVPLLMIGTLAGGRCAYVLVKKMIAAEARDDRKEQAEKQKAAEEHPMPSAVKPKQPSRVRTSTEETDREDGNV